MIILHVQETFEDASGSKYARNLNMACKGYTEFWIRPNVAPYASIMPEYALMPVSMPEFAECPWKRSENA